MPGLFDGSPLERPVTCAVCGTDLDECTCPRDARGAVLLPREQRVTVRKEKRSRGKAVTTVSGLDPVASDLAAILGRLRNVCGAGGTVHEGTIEVQGDHRRRAGEVLTELGYRVTVVD